MIDPAALPTIYFLRHGETEWNRQRRVQGQIDTDLNETGLGQARQMAAKLAEVLPDPSGFQLLASPLKRTRQTMAAVLAAYGLDEGHVTFDDRLVELNFGIFEGRFWSDIHDTGVQPEVDPSFESRSRKAARRTAPVSFRKGLVSMEQPGASRGIEAGGARRQIRAVFYVRSAISLEPAVGVEPTTS